MRLVLGSCVIPIPVVWWFGYWLSPGISGSATWSMVVGELLGSFRARIVEGNEPTKVVLLGTG